MPVRARFRPHPRGFGFLTTVADDGVTPAPAPVAGPDGAGRDVDSAFVPPPLARDLVADDLVDAELTLDDKGATATAATVVERPRRMLAGTLQQGPGRVVLEPDPGLASGWIALEDELARRLTTSVGRQVVVLCATDDDGAPVGRALVAGPHVVGSPAAIRAVATIVTLGRAAPSLISGGATAAGIEPATAETTHVRLMGLLASGGRGAAAGLSVDGPVPAADLTPTDRRDEPAVTVDAATARDLDDAVAARWDGRPDGDVEVAVHIADVAGVVGVGSPADLYARTVGATAYLVVGDNAPMLDPALSEDALSMLPGVDRRVLSARFRVRPDGTVADVEVEAALVRSRARLTYAALDRWLDGDADELRGLAGDEADTSEELLRAALEASRRLGVERDARVTFEELFDQAELTPAVVDGRLTTVEAEPHVRAYRLVERLMVAANEAVARWLVARDVPALYRAHAGLDPERLARLRAAVTLAGAKVPALDDAAAEVDVVVGQILTEVEHLGAEGRSEDRDLLVAAATSSTARASYDPDPSHHRGLAAAPYTHFTSPIRRYADLVVHRQLRAALADEDPPHAVEDLAALADWLDARAGALNHLQARERGDLWARLLDRGLLTEPEPATVTGLSQAGIRLRVPRLGVTAFVTAERALGLPAGERGRLAVDDHGLATTSGPWRLGTRVPVRFVGLDDTGRTLWRLGEGERAGG